jgi:TPR repeat protein
MTRFMIKLEMIFIQYYQYYNTQSNGNLKKKIFSIKLFVFTMTDKMQVSDKVNISNINNSIIQNFNKINIKELEPTVQNTSSGEDLSILIYLLVNHILKKLNRGEEEKVIRRYIINYIENFMIDISSLFLINPYDSDLIYLLGYLNYNGIETNVNKQKAFELYQKAAELGNIIAQLELTDIYIHGKGIGKNYIKAFELSEKLAKEGNPNAINRLAYCYELGIGTETDIDMAFELYQKSANLGNIRAQCNLALMYKDGACTEINHDKAFELIKKSADAGHSTGINLLGYFYNNGIGTDINIQKAFELYQKAANLGNSIAQYNLAAMYECGENNEIELNMDKAIYWYKKSAEQGDVDAQNKLDILQNVIE